VVSHLRKVHLLWYNKAMKLFVSNQYPYFIGNSEVSSEVKYSFTVRAPNNLSTFYKFPASGHTYR